MVRVTDNSARQTYIVFKPMTLCVAFQPICTYIAPCYIPQRDAEVYVERLVHIIL